MINSNRLSFYVLALYFMITSMIYYTNPFVKVISQSKEEVDVKKLQEEFFYFVQITDTHISAHKKNNFDEFFNFINKIDPDFLINTGDVTDGVNSHGEFYSTKEDFDVYFSSLKKLKCKSYVVLGNHDTFGHHSSLENYFANDFNQSFEYNGCLFVLLDGTLKDRPKGILNFFGIFEDDNFLKKLPMKMYKKIFLCTHYPTTTLISKYTITADVILCGHLHTYWSMIHRKHSNGVVELVGKNYKNGRFRIFTVDNGIISFNDFDFNDKPKVVIISPTDKLLKNKIKDKKFIKILQFFSDKIVIYADGKSIFEMKINKRDLQSNKIIKIPMPSECKVIKVVGYNEFGSTFHEIFLEKDRFNITTIHIPFKYIPFFFLVLYLILIYRLRETKSISGTLIRMTMRILLPNAYVKLYTEKYVFLFSFGTYLQSNFESFMFFMSTSFIYES
ncbi:hypothetical protein H312_00213, partial [Anncaliia algerae PRA339]